MPAIQSGPWLADPCFAGAVRKAIALLDVHIGDTHRQCVRHETELRLALTQGVLEALMLQTSAIALYDFGEDKRQQVDIALTRVLDDVVIDPSFEGFDSEIFSPGSGQEHKGDRDVTGPQGSVQLQTGHPRQLVISHHQIPAGLLLRELRQRLLSALAEGDMARC